MKVSQETCQRTLFAMYVFIIQFNISMFIFHFKSYYIIYNIIHVVEIRSDEQSGFVFNLSFMLFCLLFVYLSFILFYYFLGVSAQPRTLFCTLLMELTKGRTS